jgi:hypothetical protein
MKERYLASSIADGNREIPLNCGFFFSRIPFNWRRECGNLRQ